MTAGIDRGGLHVILWQRSAAGRIHVVQTKLADELHVSKFTVNRVLKRMVAEGRLVPLNPQRHRSHTYRVVDPRDWYREHPHG